MTRASSSGETIDQSIDIGIEKDSDCSGSIREGGEADGDLEKKRLEEREHSGDHDSPRRCREEEDEVAEVGEVGDDACERIAATEKPGLGGLSGVLSKVISRASTVEAGPPPDGGAKAWMIGMHSLAYPLYLACVCCVV